MKKKFLFSLLLAASLGTWARTAQAQWQTQSILIKPGWTAVYVYVDASYTNLDYLVGGDPSNPISEIWLWEPPYNTIQYVTSAQTPVTGGVQWANWERLNTGLSGSLGSLAPNSAYLIHSTASTNYLWQVKGHPTAPSYFWSTTSINLIGFPTVNSTNGPRLDAFLAPAPALQSLLTSDNLDYYPGGNLSAVNPGPVFSPHSLLANRGQAFWMNTPAFANAYFGPFQVVMTAGAAVFGDAVAVTSFRLINTTASNLTVSVNLRASEPPPNAGFPLISGTPPLLVRGALNSTNLTYSAMPLNSTTPVSWNLAPKGQAGSDIAVILGVDQTRLTNAPGALLAGILQFTDNLGLTEVDLPVSATASSYAGLWVGSATLTQVANYLKNYQTNGDGTVAQYASGTNAGAYVISSVNTNLGAVSSSATYPVRLILHNDGTNVNLLQRVFVGADAHSNSILATAESALDPAQLGSARRISAIHFPWTPQNQSWLMAGVLSPGATLTAANITVSYDDQAANPFLHTYHPDHDNLDATFHSQLPIGSESYGISRKVTLQIVPPGNDFVSLTQFGKTFSGAYLEAVTLTGLGGATRTFNVAGSFALNRLSNISVLTRGQ